MLDMITVNVGRRKPPAPRRVLAGSAVRFILSTSRKSLNEVSK